MFVAESFGKITCLWKEILFKKLLLDIFRENLCLYIFWELIFWHLIKDTIFFKFISLFGFIGDEKLQNPFFKISWLYPS